MLGKFTKQLIVRSCEPRIRHTVETSTNGSKTSWILILAKTFRRPT